MQSEQPEAPASILRSSRAAQPMHQRGITPSTSSASRVASRPSTANVPTPSVGQQHVHWAMAGMSAPRTRPASGTGALHGVLSAPRTGLASTPRVQQNSHITPSTGFASAGGSQSLSGAGSAVQSMSGPVVAYWDPSRLQASVPASARANPDPSLLPLWQMQSSHPGQYPHSMMHGAPSQMPPFQYAAHMNQITNPQMPVDVALRGPRWRTR